MKTMQILNYCRIEGKENELTMELNYGWKFMDGTEFSIY